MSLTEAPHSIYEGFKQCNLDAAIANPKSVFNFCTTFYSKIITNLPCLISDTPFEDVDCFKQFLTYLSYKCDKFPSNYPLLLTATGKLRLFKNNSKVLASVMCELFQCSSDLFLHPELLNLQLSPILFLEPSECDFCVIEKILNENLPSGLKQDIASSSYITEDYLKSIWDCITFERYFRQHKSRKAY